jgi:hypothetical protein
MPSANGENAGRDLQGRFVKGNPGGPGNPYARRVAALRSALLETVTEAEIRELVGVLLQSAKKGDISAARLLLGYAIGAAHAILPADPDRVDLEDQRLQAEKRNQAESDRYSDLLRVV